MMSGDCNTNTENRYKTEGLCRRMKESERRGSGAGGQSSNDGGSLNRMKI